MKADIRIDGIDPIAKLFPPCAVTSRWEEGSFIEELLPSAFKKPFIKRIVTEHDHALYICCENYQVVIVAGTKCDKAMRRNVFGGFPISNNGFHESYLTDGSKLFDELKPHLNYKPAFVAGYSRGGPLAAVVGKCLQENGPVAPQVVVGYCLPPPVNRKGSAYLKSIGLNMVNVINVGDMVDNLGWPLLRHYGERVDLPKTGAFHKIPILRRLFGHAYSSTGNALLVKYQNHRREFEYLADKTWWGNI